MFFTYILRSFKNRKSYVGSTKKIPTRRLDEHNLGSNKWTRSNGQFKLIYYESYYCKKDAIHREKFLKSGIGNRIVKIIIKEFDNGV